MAPITPGLFLSVWHVAKLDNAKERERERERGRKVIMCYCN
jgi:hypothetical protein